MGAPVRLIALAGIVVFSPSVAGLTSVGQRVGAGPLAKVITLLEEMEGQVQNDAAQDESVYSKYKCWCKTNEKEKTAAIETASAHLAEIATLTEEAAAAEAQLKTEINQLGEDNAQ